jgi:hypothetical protein
MGNPFTRRDSDRLLGVLETDPSVAAVINVLEEFSGYDMPDGERLTVMKLINSYRRNYPDLSVKLQPSEINGLRLILEPNQEGGQNQLLNRRLTPAEADAMRNILQDDPSAGAAINVAEDLLRYNMPSLIAVNIPSIIDTIRARHPDLSSPVGEEQRHTLNQFIAQVLGPPPRRRGGVNERLNRRLTRADADSMRALLRNDPSAGAAINVLQDLLRYDIAPSARANAPIVINALRSDYPDLSTHVTPKQVAMLEEIIRRILLPSNQNGGFRRRSQTARFNRCVKTVKKSIVPRPDSNKESAAIAICTKSVLQTRGRTLKKYRKGRIRTQKLLR